MTMPEIPELLKRWNVDSAVNQWTELLIPCESFVLNFGFA